MALFRGKHLWTWFAIQPSACAHQINIQHNLFKPLLRWRRTENRRAICRSIFHIGAHSVFKGWRERIFPQLIIGKNDRGLNSTFYI